jgi:hypothetical protein
MASSKWSWTLHPSPSCDHQGDDHKWTAPENRFMRNLADEREAQKGASLHTKR